MIRHAVQLQFNEDTTAAHLAAVTDALDALPDAIPGIASFEVVRNLGHPASSADLMVLATFSSIDDFNEYQAHPEHQRVIAELIRPQLAQRSAIQWEA